MKSFSGEILKASSVVVLTAIMATGPSGCSEFTEHPQPVPSETGSASPDYNYKAACDSVPESDINTVKQLFAATARSFDQGDQFDSTPAKGDIDAVTEGIIQRQKVTAEKLGLTVYDYRTEFNDLAQNIYGKTPEAIPTSEYLDLATGFLKRYGVDLVVDPTKKQRATMIFPDNVRPFTKQEILSAEGNDSLAIKRELYGFISSIGEMPVELVKDAGLKRLVLVHIKKIGNVDAAGYADIDEETPDTIYADPSKPLNVLIPHEMTHLWDAEECGPIGMSNDTQFNALNPTPTLYTDHTGFTDLMSSYTQTSSLLGDIQEPHTNSEKAAIQSQIDSIDKTVVVVEDYSFTDIAEDKATIGQDLFDPFGVRILIDSNNTPVLQAKAELLAARVYEEDPAVLKYLATVGPPSLNK